MENIDVIVAGTGPHVKLNNANASPQRVDDRYLTAIATELVSGEVRVMSCVNEVMRNWIRHDILTVVHLRSDDGWVKVGIEEIVMEILQRKPVLLLLRHLMDPSPRVPTSLYNLFRHFQCLLFVGNPLMVGQKLAEVVCRHGGSVICKFGKNCFDIRWWVGIFYPELSGEAQTQLVLLLAPHLRQ